LGEIWVLKGRESVPEQHPILCRAQAKSGAAQVQALKQVRAAAEKVAARAAEGGGVGGAGRPRDADSDNVLTHWVRSAADMSLKVRAPETVHALSLCISLF
jgi:hypothetical protein